MSSHLLLRNLIRLSNHGNIISETLERRLVYIIILQGRDGGGEDTDLIMGQSELLQETYDRGHRD